MSPAPITDGDSDQTMPFITSGASDDGKWMIAGGIGQVFNVGAWLSAVGQLFESGTHVDTGTSLFVGLKG